MDTAKHFHSISLSHPLIKFKVLVNAGMIDQALEWVPRLDPQLHEREAAFLSKKGVTSQVISSDSFKLGDEFKFKLCIQNGLPIDALNAVIQLRNKFQRFENKQCLSAHPISRKKKGGGGGE